jgi:hypothetical protein
VSVDPSGKEFPVYQYCITGRVRLRSEPSLAGRVTGLIEEGEKTAVLGESREKTAFTFHDRRYTSRWLKLRRGNGDEGWAQGIFFHENRFPHREEIGKTGIYPLGWGPSGTFAFFEFMGDSCARDCGDVSLVLFNGKTGKRSSYLTHSCVRDVQNHREQHIVPLYEILGREGITHAGTYFTHFTAFIGSRNYHRPEKNGRGRLLFFRGIPPDHQRARRFRARHNAQERSERA